MVRSLGLFLLFFFTSSCIVQAEEINDSNGAVTSLIRVIASLSIILLLIFISFRFLAQKKGTINSGFYQHLGGIPLGQNKTVQVVEIGNKIYILGVGEDVQLLQVIEDKQDLQAIKEFAAWQGSQQTVTDWLKGKFNRKGRDSKKEDHFQQIFTEKMEQLKEKRMESINQWLDDTNERIENRGHHE